MQRLTGTPMKKNFCIVMLRLLCVLFLCTASVQARNLVIAQAYWEDPTGQVPFSEAQTQIYTPYKGVLNNGFTDSATWLRLRISHQTSNPLDRHIVLRVQPNHLDEVELFDPLEPTLQPRRVGDRTSYASQEYKSPSYGFLMPIGHEDRDVWLRAKSANLHVIEADAYGEIAMQSEEKDYLLSASICLGLILFIFTLNLFNWTWNREWIYTIFIFRTFYFIGVLSIYFGVIRQYSVGAFPPDLLDTLFSLAVIINTPLNCYFEFALLREYGLKSWTRWLQYFIYLIAVLALVLFAFGMKSQALWLTAIVVVVLFLALFFISIAGLKHRFSKTPKGELGVDKRYFIAYYFSLIFTHPLVSQRLLEMAGLTPVILSMFPYYALMSTLWMTVIVQFRANNIRKNHNELQLNIALMNERMSHERQRREEQSNLLSMLMHEVRNPLAVIEVAQNQENAGNEELVRKNVSIIRSVLDRTMRLEKVSDGQLQIEKTRFLFSDCLAQALDDVGADERRVSLVRIPEAEICTDFESLHIILVNLLGNALKYSPADDVVQLEVVDASLPERLVFVVSNRIGDCGQPDADRVFEKYYRGEGAKKLSGTGVGLYLVQQLVQRMGGTCTYVSDSNTIRFEVSLPVSDA
jgi:two-component system, sensor histidine kinase LadS